MNVRFMFAWYDFWVGVFVDTKKRRVYVFPVPMFGLVIDCGPTWIPGKLSSDLPCRKHWWTGEVQILLHPKGRMVGEYTYKEDYWHPAHSDHWKDFTPDK